MNEMIGLNILICKLKCSAVTPSINAKIFNNKEKTRGSLSKQLTKSADPKRPENCLFFFFIAIAILKIFGKISKKVNALQLCRYCLNYM